jgi:hypothetical protein
MLIAFLRNLNELLIDKSRVIVRTRIWRVLQRHQIILRRTTQQAQITRLNTIKEHMTIYDVNHANIANFDETPVYLSPLCDLTLIWR